MKPKSTRYEYVEGVKMQVSTFDVYEMVDGRKVHSVIETRNAVDTFGLN